MATASGDGWAELPLLVHRVCGALACAADVTLLLVDRVARPPENDGAVRVLTFVGPVPDRRKELAQRRALFGPDPVCDGGIDCACTTALRESLARYLPVAAQEVLLRSAGGDSPELFAHLRSLPYDVVVFAGCATASTYWGLEAVAGRRRTVLVPGAIDDPVLAIPAVVGVLRGVDAVLVTTDHEADLVARCGAGPARERLHNVGFVLQVADLSSRTAPYGFDAGPTFVVAGDWNEPLRGHDRVVAWATRLRDDLGGRAAVRFVGPGVQRLPAWARAPFTSARVDAWRWMARARAVIDPAPHRIVGRTALESLLFGIPVIVPADGGASRHHAEAGDGGLWYWSYGEFHACVTALLDSELSSTLGTQGRAYAERHYCDTDGFVRRVEAATLGTAAVPTSPGATGAGSGR